jgi:hypothetical protein
VTAVSSPRERLPLGLLTVFTLLLLALSRSVPLPPEVKAWAALGAVFVVPGMALALLWPGLARAGWPALVALSFPLSLLPVLGAAVLGWTLHWPALPLGAAYLFGTFVVVLVALIRGWRRDPGEHPPRSVAWFLGLLLLAGVILAARAGAPVGPATDGPDHEATVNEILTSGEMFPHQALMPAGELNRSDPRKGVFHVGLALAAALAGVSARTVWTAAPAILVGPWLALIYVLGVRLGLGRWGALLAALLALLFTGGYGGSWTVRLGYGAHAGLVVAWAATWVLLGLVRSFDVSDVLLFAVFTAVAASVHPLAPVFVYLPGVVLLFAARRDPWVVEGRILGTLAAGVAVAAPILVWRFVESRGAVNPLHVQSMPVLSLGVAGSILYPPQALRILGPAGVLALILLPGLRRFLADRWGRRYLVAATVAALAPALVPGLFDLAAATLSSLPVKLLYLTPLSWILAAFLSTAWRRGGIPLRGAAAAVLLFALPGALSGFSPASVAEWRPAGVDAGLDLLRAVPGEAVVAADPWVSSLIAAETAHQPITVLHQHGHPLDPRGLDRLNDLSGILSPWLGPRRTLDLMDRHHAVYVLLPEPREAPLRVDFGAARGGDLDRRRVEKFASAPGAFHEVDRASGWVLYGVGGTTSRTANRGSPPVLPPVASGSGGWPVGGSDGIAEGVRLVGLDVPPRITPGRAVPVVLRWTTDGLPTGWPVEAHLRFTRVGERPGLKLGRLLVRFLPGTAPAPHRFRRPLSPFEGAWPTSFWPASLSLADTEWVSVPEGAPPGPYDVSVRVLPRPMFTRVSWRDVWSDRDRWQGHRLGSVVISPSMRKTEGSS